MTLYRAKKMVWPCRVMANSNRHDGTRVSMDRMVDGAGDVIAAMQGALAKRKDGGYPFLGCEVIAITPLGQRIIRVLDPDTGLLVE